MGGATAILKQFSVPCWSSVSVALSVVRIGSGPHRHEVLEHAALIPVPLGKAFIIEINTNP